MTVSSEALDTSPCKVDTLEALSAVFSQPYSLALWERAPLPDISLELRQLPATAFPGARARIHAGKVGEELAELIRAQSHNAETAFPAWLADMTRLSEAFFDLAGGRPVTARLEILDGTGCPRFHVDHSYLRLVCTYRGPGTEWLEDTQVDRRAQAGGAPRFGQPSRMPTFAVGLMTGSRFPGHTEAGLVHRSPAPGPADPARVLFCLDC